MWTAPSSLGYIAPSSSLSWEWTRLLGWIRCPWIEGVVDVVLDQLEVLEHMLDRDLVVQARRVQELFEAILWRTGLGLVVLVV
jgi:hypothetical protein